jgi:DNA modification methylase
VSEDSRRITSLKDFKDLLRALTGLEGDVSPPVEREVSKVLARLGSVNRPDLEVTRAFYGQMNQKLGANKGMLSQLYGEAAAAGVTFNYPTKKSLAWAADSDNGQQFKLALDTTLLGSTPLAMRLQRHFRPATHATTRRMIAHEAQNPTKLRKAHERSTSLDVLDATAGPLVWALWPAAQLATLFAGRTTDTARSHMAELRSRQPELFERKRSLVVRYGTPPTHGYSERRREVTEWLRYEYQHLDNYGYVALVLDVANEKSPWELVADTVLFAERFDEYPLTKSFFRSAEIAASTSTWVPVLPEMARFDHVNEGFSYRDVFVVKNESDEVGRLVLLMQKNSRDEAAVPCPACRGTEIAGNSYPSLGVKSWECQNLLCPERSIYNRGKRYSFKALLMQEAIEDSANEIPVESVRRWQRDVVEPQGDQEIFDTLVRHYSKVGDRVILLGNRSLSTVSCGRQIAEQVVPHLRGERDFWTEAAFFNRYATVPIKANPRATETRDQFLDAWEIIEGDAGQTLAGVADNIFDRAVTSPPYFNARAYAQWPNLYCYLYDMRSINAQVFRTLKPGAMYAYNIFDYFDNESTVVFSDMGRKRISLTSLMVDLFRRIGFHIVGNAVWDKGDIHGKRGFNAGNFSPFYQSPFNCWEHVLLLRKPSADGSCSAESGLNNRILPIHPVVKMVRGENTYGHTAPFPVELAEAMLLGLGPNSLVLDPFAGSGSTGRAALNAGARSVLLERDQEYCELSRRLLKQHEADLAYATQPLW